MIAFAGGVVIIVFMAMVLSSLSIFRSIGPALAIAVALAVESFVSTSRTVGISLTMTFNSRRLR